MLAIAGGKGGCGKTTTALGLARALADRGARPLVVDADCDMPNLHTMADTDPSPGLAAYADGATLERVVHRSQVCPGVDVVPAGRATGPVDAALLRRLARTYGRVLVDCPAGASDAVAGPLRAADAVLVVSTADHASRVDAAKTARMAGALDTPVVGAVVTRVEPSEQTPTGPLTAECRPLVEVPELDLDGDPAFRNPVGQSSYERLADRLQERNI